MITRTEAIMFALGWQGGTVHQSSQETGISVANILDGQPSSEHTGSDYCGGWFAARTNDLAFNTSNVFPKYHGNVDFWLGVARGMQLKHDGV